MDRYAQSICKRALVLSRNWQNITYFGHVDIKLKKGRSVFDFDTVVISEQSFFIIFSVCLEIYIISTWNSIKNI